MILCWFACPAQYRFDSWTTDNGLPQNGVRGITQTPDGYLWFTTLDGLVRFDGIKFKIFNKSNSSGLTTNRLFNLRSAGDGTLWISTEKNDLVIYRNGTFKTFSADIIPGGSIFGFLNDENGDVLIEGLAGTYSFRNEQFELIRANDADGTQKAICNGRSGTKWTVRPSETTEERDGIIRTYPIENRTISFYDGSVFEDSGGALWIGDLGRLWRLKDGRWMSYIDLGILPASTRPHGFWEESDGSIWFATGDFATKGVGLIRFKDGNMSRFGSENGLSNDRILSHFKDREGTVWLATEKGINRLRPQQITSLSVKDGLLDNEVYPILKARNNTVYIGAKGGISRYKDGNITNYAVRFKFDPSLSVSVQSLAEDSHGRIWIGVVGGLFVLDGETVREMTGLFATHPTIWAISPESDGTILLGTERDGIVTLKDGTTTSHLTTADGLADNDVKFLHRAADGSLWIGTYGGLSHYTNGEFKNFTVADGLASNSVRWIKDDGDGTIWIGTYDGGISRIRNGSVFNFNTGNGLYSDGAFAIVEDKRGRFWISSNQGIYSVDKAELNEVADGHKRSVTSSGYGRQEGMLNIECNGGRQPAAMTDDLGRIWFPTIEGVAIVDPDLTRGNSIPPPILIESIAIDRDNVAFTDVVDVSPSQIQLEITYTGLSFIKSDQVRFKYRLDGLDDDWIDAGTKRTVSYAHLPPGMYTFKVTAANADGVWNQEGRSVKIVVRAPFYKTWQFAAAAAVCIFAAIFFIYNNRVKHLKKLNAAQEAFSRQLIESQEAERKRIAQELHDGLGQSLLIIKNRASLGLIAAEREKADEQFGEIRDSVTDALSEVRVIAQNLRPLHLDRLGLRSTIEEMIEQVDEASAIAINCDIGNIDGKLSPENEMNFYRVVQESLSNIVKHSGASKASVSVELDENSIDLVVRDDGHGFDPASSKENAGMGLNGIAERVKILGGSFSIESDSDRGTTMSVHVPL